MPAQPETLGGSLARPRRASGWRGSGTARSTRGGEGEARLVVIAEGLAVCLLATLDWKWLYRRPPSEAEAILDSER